MRKRPRWASAASADAASASAAPRRSAIASPVRGPTVDRRRGSCAGSQSRHDRDHTSDHGRAPRRARSRSRGHERRLGPVALRRARSQYSSSWRWWRSGASLSATLSRTAPPTGRPPAAAPSALDRSPSPSRRRRHTRRGSPDSRTGFPLTTVQRPRRRASSFGIPHGKPTSTGPSASSLTSPWYTANAWPAASCSAVSAAIVSWRNGSSSATRTCFERLSTAARRRALS